MKQDGILTVLLIVLNIALLPYKFCCEYFCLVSWTILNKRNFTVVSIVKSFLKGWKVQYGTIIIPDPVPVPHNGIQSYE